jgi:hypothetical protein
MIIYFYLCKNYIIFNNNKTKKEFVSANHKFIFIAFYVLIRNKLY